MRVFISWADKESRSHAIAEALRDWLPNVIQAIQPWMSNHSIEKGTKGLFELDGALESIPFGIVCLTPESMHADWINFEAGSLSKTSPKLWTFLLDLRPTDVTGPLAKFQHTTFERQEIREFLGSVNTELTKAGGGLTDAQLDKALAKNWPDLEADVTRIRSMKAPQQPRRQIDEMVEELLTLQREYVRIMDALVAKQLQGSGADGYIKEALREIQFALLQLQTLVPSGPFTSAVGRALLRSPQKLSRSGPLLPRGDRPLASRIWRGILQPSLLGGREEATTVASKLQNSGLTEAMQFDEPGDGTFHYSIRFREPVNRARFTAIVGRDQSPQFFPEDWPDDGSDSAAPDRTDDQPE